MSLKQIIKQMSVVLVLVSCAYFVDAATVAQSDHCCRNELCPIDCVKCDGKVSCYDLSDELGCSNETDAKLLGYEKPPIFVPIILAVLKAQIRREKVELAYRFSDRSCFAPVTSAPLGPKQPSYDLKDNANIGPVTTETPVWLQLLNKLRETVGVKPTTTTTTEIPVWKILLNKLKAEENGVTYTTSTTANLWSERVPTTTLPPPVLQTAPSRRTGRPPVAKGTERVTTEQADELKTEQKIVSISAKPVPSGVPVTVFFTPPEHATVNILLQDISTEQTTANLSRTTSLSSSSRNKLLTELLTNTPAAEVSSPISQIKTEDISATVTVSTTFIPENDKNAAKIRSVTTASEANSNTSHKPDLHYSQTTAKSVTEIPTSSARTFRTETKNMTEIPKSLNTTFRTKTKNITEIPKSLNTTFRTETIDITEIPTSLNTTFRAETKNITEIPTHSTIENRTESINITEIPKSSTMESRMGTINVTEIPAFSTTEPINTTKISKSANMNHMAETKYSSHLNNSQERSQNISSAQSEITKYIKNIKLRNDTENITSSFPNVDIQAENRNSTEKNIPDAFIVTTDLPFLATVDTLLVTMSTEYARTVTELETPSPLQERTALSDSVNKTLETNQPEIKLGYNDSTTAIYNDTSEDNARANKNTTEMAADGIITQYEINTTPFVNNEMFNANNSQSSLNLTFDIDRVSNPLDMNYALEGSFANEKNSSLVSANSTSSDFKYSNFDTLYQEIVNTSLRYSMDKTGMSGFELYNRTYQTDNLRSLNATQNGRQTFSVAVMEKQEKTSKTLKDRLASPAFQVSPENEVRIMLGKLNTMISETLASSDFPSRPALREFNETQPGTINVQKVTTVYPPLVTEPTTRPPVTQYPERSQVTSPPQIATVTRVPWWRQTTHSSSFSLDNLFGFTTPPLARQNWFNPTTSAWDALFGVGDIPVSQVATVPPYNANQVRLNDIYDPLMSEGQMQPTPVPPSVQTSGIFESGISLKTEIPALQTTIFQQSLPATVKPTTNIYSNDQPTTKSYSSQTILPTSQSSMVFNIFDTRVNSPGNFSIKESRSQPAAGKEVYSTLTFKQNLNGNIETTTSKPAEKTIMGAGTFSPVTFPPVRLPNKDSVTENLVSYIPTTTMSPLRLEQKYNPAIFPVTTPVVRNAYDKTPQRLVTTVAPYRPTKSVLSTFTKVVSKLWDKPAQTTTQPATQSIPVTRPAIPTNPTTSFPSWDSGSNRILSTDIISSWWAQVQSTTTPPAYVTQPTPTPMPAAEQCYEVQDFTGFCQTRYTGHYKNPGDCRSFYVCIWGFLHSCTCPPNTMFDDKVNVCNWDYLVTCPTQP